MLVHVGACWCMWVHVGAVLDIFIFSLRRIIQIKISSLADVRINLFNLKLFV